MGRRGRRGAHWEPGRGASATSGGRPSWPKAPGEERRKRGRGKGEKKIEKKKRKKWKREKKEKGGEKKEGGIRGVTDARSATRGAWARECSARVEGDTGC